MSVFRISVYDKNRNFRGQVGNPLALEVTPRFDSVGTLRMTVHTSHKRFDDLFADGARLKVSFRGEHLISGPIIADEMVTDGTTGTYTVTVEDDWRVLREILGWPVPASTISNQTAAEYRTYTGNAETVLKDAVTENGVNRLAVPGLTVAPNLNRGAVIPGGVPLRMHPLADQLYPALTEAGVGVSVKQVGSNLVLDVYEPQTHPRALSVRGRTLKQATLTRKRPTASRVVVGGQGEGTARNFRLVTDTAREAQYGMKAETFRDARDNDAADVMDSRANETLTETGPQNGIALTLAGSGIFQYGPGGFHVGDRIPVEVAPGVVITEVIQECTLKWVSPQYASSDPKVGELTNQPERVTAQRMAALNKRLRNQEAR